MRDMSFGVISTCISSKRRDSMNESANANRLLNGPRQPCGSVKSEFKSKMRM